MTEDVTQKVDGEGQDDNANGNDDLQQTFPRSYVEQLRKESEKYRNRAKDAESAIKDYEKQIKERDDKQLEEQQKWRELAESRQQELEELSGYKGRYEDMLDNIKTSNERRIESIPQDMRTLVPDLEPISLAQWLDANTALLKRPGAPDLNASAGNNDRPGGQEPLTQEELEIARKLGVSEEEYIKRKR